MPKVPSMSSRELVKLLEKGGAAFIRQGSTDHAIYSRIIEGKRYSAPIQMGKKTLDSVYCKRILRQLKFTDEESVITVTRGSFKELSLLLLLVLPSTPLDLPQTSRRGNTPLAPPTSDTSSCRCQ